MLKPLCLVAALSIASPGFAQQPSAAHAPNGVNEDAALRSAVELIFTTTARSMSSEEAALVATALDAPEYLAAPANTDFEILSGSLTRLGERFGSTVGAGPLTDIGIYWNSGSDAVLVRFSETDEVVQVPMGGLVFFGVRVHHDHGPSTGRGEIGGSRSASVQCNENYYACCNYGECNPTARCVRYDMTADCDVGGPGAGSCTISQNPGPKCVETD